MSFLKELSISNVSGNRIGSIGKQSDMVDSKSSSRSKASTSQRNSSLKNSTTGSIGPGSERSKSMVQKMRHKKLFKRRNELKIVVDDDDVTPAVLNALNYKSNLGRKSGSQLDVLKSGTTAADGIFSTVVQSTLALNTQIQTISISCYLSGTTQSSLIRTTDDEPLSDSISWLKESSEELETVSQAHDKVQIMMPSSVNITLTETPVMYVYELPSVTAEKDTEEGDLVEQQNERYDYLTVGKGRNRKTTPAEIQTNETVQKTRFTQAERCKRKNSYSFASGWDMLDTYNGVSEVVQGKTVIKKIPDSKDPAYFKYREELNRQLLALTKNSNFQNACIVMERILANNVYNEQQKRFRGLIEQDPFRPDIEFKYNLDLLWTFKNSNTEGHPVTSMHWNPANKDILAVGYGKFFYNENKSGFVYCWNIKNPTQPEREIYYTRPVTSVAFSSTTPNVLAVGLYDGSVEILDISHRNVTVIAVTSENFSPSHDPIWQVAWLDPEELNPDEEVLVCCGEDGRICRLNKSKTREFLPMPLMKTLPIEGKLKGVYQPRHCPVTDVPLDKCSAALLIAKHPADKNKYFIGTDEGTIHRCSKHFVNQHIDMFLAHSGPVYSCQFSPFCSKLFLTCGADWTINVWTEVLLEPLITLTKTMESVEGACWSPANSTIIASIVGAEIFIWDIQRRLYLPTAVHKNPTNSRNTLIQFTDSGRNLVVADIEGNVHIYSLEDMPFPPFYQSEMLVNVIKKQLVAKKSVLDELSNICQ